MLKRLFWLFVGMIIGVLVVTKARAYVKGKLPESARNFFFDKEPENLTLSTILGLCKDFNTSRKAHETELNNKYARRSHSARGDIF
ncbi:hypothetical protein [Gardnerella sp. 2492-Sm]|uniref:hypothetical protein n=1 Tax=unclassified Gardnerella TaxID=2628112 RepID=UPI003CFDE29A